MSENERDAICLRSICKEFKRGYPGGMLGKLLHANETTAFNALTDINLTVRKGEAIGVIGGNGSGKTTLAKVIAGIYHPTSGDMKLIGTALYISGFGGLINKNASVRDNILMIGAIVGMSRIAAKAAMKDIIAEAELSGYESARAGSLSNGMLARLSFFSLMRFMQDQMPDILILDEVLSAGGDMCFKDKALASIRSLLASGGTVLIISHALTTIENLCTRTIWMEKGSIRKDGLSAEVIASYKETGRPKAVV